MNERRVTLASVAERVGVSAITVSRALRTPEKVSPPLLEKIQRAIADLGYVPDPAARALASGRTNVIGVLIPSVTNNVFSDVLRGIYAAVEGEPFEIQLGNSRYSPVMEETLLRVFLSQKPAGLIVAGIDQSAASRKMLETAPCPTVQIMELGPDPIDMMIGFSHYDGAAAATRHLLETGSRYPAFVGARMDPRTQRRFAGFRDTCEAAGLFSEARCITTPAPSTVTLGTQLFADLIARHPKIDGVFCNNDDLALGILFEAQRRHIRVPADLTICGFNDLEMMAVAEPSITSVRTYRYDMGRRAIEMISARIRGGDGDTPAVVDLGFQLQPRQSTARAG
ncbi:Gluconate utilization system GNT-I transcriptional repressor [Hartmannibacter diazotrophicus]|uniref:Gluconate utilization system GNT-I transcriptional repressor n=1 Tax=Hartmannibacter diazotrophicus TaxID=1482074 RepID=A0A2C9D3X8_9HYPH|nr:LacI family DNA-binding transcriptional regulator [Hartmannibacter diazotrophicus]SON54976.1 Gluconate utilization system GNT-I transcriptional repressor [Hartmannibacter diazotrophicus]